MNRDVANRVFNGDMRNFPWPCGLPVNFAPRGVVLGIVVAAVAAVAAPVYADELTGSYDVKFEQVSTNCEHPLNYSEVKTLKIDVKGGDVQVVIERNPPMVGKSAKTNTNKISAKSPKPSPTSMAGMDGVFSVAGRVTPEGMLSLVMVGEYQAAGKPLCTQSWNLSGLKAQPDKPNKPDKSDKPKK